MSLSLLIQPANLPLSPLPHPFIQGIANNSNLFLHVMKWLLVVFSISNNKNTVGQWANSWKWVGLKGPKPPGSDCGDPVSHGDRLARQISLSHCKDCSGQEVIKATSTLRNVPTSCVYFSHFLQWALDHKMCVCNGHATGTVLCILSQNIVKFCSWITDYINYPLYVNY